MSFTHHFGKFADAAGDINDSFELEFMNEIFPEYHYTMMSDLHKISVNKYKKTEMKRNRT
jgi:hypothetical protein